MGRFLESTSSEYARFLAYGNQLIEIHIGLRDQIAQPRLTSALLQGNALDFGVDVAQRGLRGGDLGQADR